MRDKHLFYHLITLLGLLYLTGCVAPSAGTNTTVTSGQGSPSMAEVQAESYNGPKARIAVSQFKDKTGGGWWSGRIGNGMADQLTTALFNTNRYIVLERQTLGDVLNEQDLGASGRIRQDTAAPIGQIEGAELLIVGAVTEFSGNSSGGGGGIGGFGRGGLLGGISLGFKKSHMAIDLRVIDTRTSRILAATSVEGEATDVKMGALMGGYGGSGALVGSLGGWKNTPTEKALRVCIKKAVEFIATKTPQRYYHYGSGSSQPKPRNTSSGSGNYGGLSRDVIQQMQSYLASLGYNVGKPDGIPGRKTKGAVQSFQQQYGLEQTGTLTPETMKKLREVATGQ